MNDNKENENNSIPEKIDSNLTAIIGITIKSFNEKYIDKKTVTFYEIEITSHITMKSWVVHRRYNEFKTLHASLSKIYLKSSIFSILVAQTVSK